MTRDHAESLKVRSAVVGVIGCALAIVAALFDRRGLLRSYIPAYVFMFGLSIGALPLLMLTNLVGGEWGRVIRRILEAQTRMLPLVALMFVPIGLFVRELYPWAAPGATAADPIFAHRAPYLNVPFFLGRTAAFYVVFIVMAFLLNRWSALDPDPEGPYGGRATVVSAPGIVVYVVLGTLLAIDWGMSLEPHWYSTMYGVLWLVSQVLTSLSFAILVLGKMAPEPAVAASVEPGHFGDLGNLLLTFVMLWAYMAFSQFLIIWSGDIPDEVIYYLRRAKDGWMVVGLVPVAFCFALPFLMLLARRVKRSPERLLQVAALVLVMRTVDLVWQIEPALPGTGVIGRLYDIACFAGLFGLWLAGFLHVLLRRPLMAQYVHSGTTVHAQSSRSIPVQGVE